MPQIFFSFLFFWFGIFFSYMYVLYLMSLFSTISLFIIAQTQHLSFSSYCWDSFMFFWIGISFLIFFCREFSFFFLLMGLIYVFFGIFIFDICFAVNFHFWHALASFSLFIIIAPAQNFLSFFFLLMGLDDSFNYSFLRWGKQSIRQQLQSGMRSKFDDPGQHRSAGREDWSISYNSFPAS